jgi:hypothetical protein
MSLPSLSFTSFFFQESPFAIPFAQLHLQKLSGYLSHTSLVPFKIINNFVVFQS